MRRDAAGAQGTISLIALLLAAAQATFPPTPAEIVAAAKPAEWVTISADDLLVMELAPDVRRQARRLVIQLIAPPFSQGWVANIRRLARAHWHDGVADRNIAVVGRAVEGMEQLSALPRGTGLLGVYATAGERTAIRSVRLASDLPEAARPQLQYLSTESASFVAYAAARANRRNAFIPRPAGGVGRVKRARCRCGGCLEALKLSKLPRNV